MYWLLIRWLITILHTVHCDWQHLMVEKRDVTATDVRQGTRDGGHQMGDEGCETRDEGCETWDRGREMGGFWDGGMWNRERKMGMRWGMWDRGSETVDVRWEVAMWESYITSSSERLWHIFGRVGCTQNAPLSRFIMISGRVGRSAENDSSYWTLLGRCKMAVCKPMFVIFQFIVLRDNNGLQSQTMVWSTYCIVVLN